MYFLTFIYYSIIISYLFSIRKLLTNIFSTYTEYRIYSIFPMNNKLFNKLLKDKNRTK